MRQIQPESENGFLLPGVIILAFAVGVTGLAFLNSGVMENRLVHREIDKNQAFYLAEAGLERTLWNLERDFDSGSGDWTDGDINGVSVGDEDENGWRVLAYEASSLLLGEGSYLVKLKYVDEKNTWVRSTGTVEDTSKTVQVYMSVENISPWNNAIFAGAGQAGQLISGNVRIHGSVHILGEGVESGDLAMDMSGTAGIRNNYEGMPAELAAVVPLCPQRPFDGQMVDSLEAKLRVKQGKVGLSGTATVGEEDWPGNSLKETMDSVYITDGYGGNKGADNVYSDNGTPVPYDLGNDVQSPSVKDQHVGSETPEHVYSTYIEYVHAKGMKITETEISSGVGKIDRYDGINSIYWDPGEGELEINGIVWVDAGTLDIGRKGETIEYEGRGILVVANINPEGEVVGTVRVHGHLIARWEFPSQDVLGIVTGYLDLATGPGESHLIMTGAFFAEKQILSAKQNEIAGTFVSNYFDMGGQVPRIYQVPSLATSLPDGMIAGEPDWDIGSRQWSEVPS